MPSRIADLLNKARSDSFFGRDNELAHFNQLNEEGGRPFFLLYLHGTAGQGKTALLKKCREICDASNILNLNLDGRDIQPHPDQFMAALRSQLPSHSNDDAFEIMAQRQGRTVLFIDSYERLLPLDDWIRQDFLPQLPDNVRTVIASRKAPSANFLADQGWRMLMKASHLRNFNPAECTEFLRRQNIPESKIGPILDFTHGHPLALSVVMDIYEQRPEQDFKPDESPDVLHALLEQFVQEVPSTNHRIALEICALAHLTTESLLAEVMGGADVAGACFEWLRGLSFVENGKFGLFPHDLVREAIVAELRWRNPDRFLDLHGKAGRYYKRRMGELSGEMQRLFLFELVFLHRTNPVVRPFFDWQENSHWMDFMKETDLPVLRGMVKHFEGEESARHFDFWAKHPAAEVWAWRDGQKLPAAFVLRIDTHKLDASATMPDPAVAKVLRYQQRQMNLRSGEQSSVFRFWMAKGTYQGVSSLQSSMFLAIVQYYFTPGLAVHFITTAHPQFWLPVFNYADLQYAPELDYEANGIPMGFFQHDWRKRPPIAWLDLLAKRETDARAGQESPLEAPSLQLVVLGEAAFEKAVAEALRNYYTSQGYERNPLLASRLVVKQTGMDAPEGERANLLKSLIATVIKEIENSPLDGKYHRVLYRTFINPVGSQEKTADFLNMSFSTYRRYLKAGIEKTVERLWKEEVE